MRAIPAVVIVCGAGLAACDHADEYDVTLADYQNQTIYVVASDQEVGFVIGDDTPMPTSAACPKIGADLTGQLGANVLQLSSRGGKIGDEPGDDVSDNICGKPVLRLAQPPPDGPSSLVITEGKGSITCQLPDLKAARAITADAWDWTVGQAVQLHWAPAGELALWAGMTVTLAHLNAAGFADAQVVAKVSSVASDTITIVVPSLTGTGGSYVVTAVPTGSVPCTPGGDQPGNSGAHVRSSLTTFSASHAITLAP